MASFIPIDNKAPSPSLSGGRPAFTTFSLTTATAAIINTASPVFTKPAFTTNTVVFIATALAGSPPVISKPAVAVRSLTSQSFALTSPVVGAPSLTQPQRKLTPTSLTLSSPVILAPSLLQRQTFVAEDLLIFVPIDFGTPSLGSAVADTTNVSAGAPELGSPSLTKNIVEVIIAREQAWRGADILYNAATGMERAGADVDGFRITALNAELIRDIWDPDACPANLLQYLAWAMGVEYWNDEWSITTKRQWVKSQWLFKSQRGTRSAIEMAVDYFGRDVSNGMTVDRVTVQPQRVFSGPSLTREQREEWLSRMPQVRAWRVQEVGFASKYKSFYGSRADLRLRDRRFILNASYTIHSTALSRLKRRVRWIEDGVETDVSITEFGTYFQIHKDAPEDGKVFCDRPFGGRHYIPSTASNRLLTILPEARLAWRSPVTPTLRAITSEPERVTVSGTRRWGVFCDVSLPSFYVPSTAKYRIFERYAVLDSKQRDLRRPSQQYMGVGRYGFPPFTAWIDMTLNGRLNFWSAGYGFFNQRRYFLPHDGRPLERARLATVAAKRLHDKILLRTGPVPRFIAGGKPVLADIDVVIVGRP